MPLEGKEKKRKKVLLATKIQAGGDKSKSILDYVDITVRPISNNQGFIGETFVTFLLMNISNHVNESVQHTFVSSSDLSCNLLVCY